MHLNPNSLALALTTFLYTAAHSSPVLLSRTSGTPAPVSCSPSTQQIYTSSGLDTKSQITISLDIPNKLLLLSWPSLSASGQTYKIGHLYLDFANPTSTATSKYHHNKWCHISADKTSHSCSIPWEQLPGGEAGICSTSKSKQYAIAAHVKRSHDGDCWCGKPKDKKCVNSSTCSKDGNMYFNFFITCKAPKTVIPTPPPVKLCGVGKAWCEAPAGVVNAATSTLATLFGAVVGLVTTCPADYLVGGNKLPIYLNALPSLSPSSTICGSAIFRVEDGLFKVGLSALEGYVLTNVSILATCSMLGGLVRPLSPSQYQICLPVTNAPSYAAEVVLPSVLGLLQCPLEALQLVINADVAKYVPVSQVCI